MIGSFSNIVAFQMARVKSSNDAAQIFIYSSIYIIIFSVLSIPIIVLAQHAGLMAGQWLSALVIAAVAASTAVGAQSIAFACSQDEYRAASLLSLMPIVAYVGLISLIQKPTALTVTGSVAIAQSLPLLATTVWALNQKWLKLSLSISCNSLSPLMRGHRDALATNISSVPQQIIIWLIARNLMTLSGANEFARYGIANQISNLFLFFPTSFAPMFISWIGKRNEAAHRIKLSFTMAFAFTGLGLISASTIVLATHVFSWLIPKEFVQAGWPMAIAMLMAGLVAARSPFAWLNQIDRRYRSEWLISAVTATFMGVSLLPTYGNHSEVVLWVRTLAAFAGVSVSAVLLIVLRRGNDV